MVIRPLAYVREQDIERYAALQDFPIIPCNLCGSQANMERQAIKAMLREWDARHPGRVANIARALGHLVPSHLLDRQAFDFAALERDAQAVALAIPLVDVSH